MYEQPITRLIEFLKGHYGDEFQAYYDGDPDEIPKANLPAIVVVKNNDRITNGPTGFQRVDEELQVKVLFDKADDWSAQSDTVQLTEKKIRDIVEARDKTTGGYAQQTVKYALMNRFRMEGVAIDQAMTFELGVVARDRTGEMMTAEGHLTISINYLMPNVVNA